jgi:hypothetical protein
VRIAKTDYFGGLPAVTAREVARRFHSFKPIQVVLDIFGGSKGLALSGIRELEADGFLEQREPGPTGELWWRATVAGNSLAMASFNRPIKRATADRLVAEMLERAASYNQQTGRPFYIARLRLFGSYLRPELPEIGDVDVEVRAIAREFSSQDFLEYADASGRAFRSHFERIAWPKQELLRTLRGGSAALSLVEEDVTDFARDIREIYRYEP